MVSARFWGFLLVAALPACQTTATTKVLVVPDEMRRTAAPSTTPGASKGKPPLTPPQKYILRMAENGRVWEMELPEATGGYEVRLPLAGGGPVEMLTSADEEMLAEAVAGAQAPKDAAEKKAEDEKKAEAPLLDANKASRTRSYLGGVARVKEMYAARRYELALIELVALEKEYPQDARLLAMKGSLYMKLGQPKLARQAWEKALSINPEDAGVAEALRATTAAGEE
ncbi:tetratricopeptide repeat protein [Melittangium boletus]|uniref:Uncharacterized protein n=1 Tax=Melittangium boletus DSM 14713 TaxID=1294270 RepID=A0A250IC60_9BACT|nr:tetratricopeptide repeat protein [Melittangium boletus]ATB28808.1 hypothetical protein MEBOL_002257 [Melittangium boletus DSM 14713]